MLKRPIEIVKLLPHACVLERKTFNGSSFDIDVLITIKYFEDHINLISLVMVLKLGSIKNYLPEIGMP